MVFIPRRTNTNAFSDNEITFMAKKSEFSKAQKEEILKQSQEFWESAERVQQPQFDMVNELERLARCLLPQELEDAFAQYPDRSALVPPDIYNNLRSLRARLRTGLFRKKPYFKLGIRGKSTVRDERVQKAESILQGIMDEENDGIGFPAQADKAIYQALYAGITTVVTRWTKRWERVVQRNEDLTLQLDEDGNPIYKQELIAEYPETLSLDIRRTRIDPSAAERKDIRIVGYHSIAQFSELVDLKNNPATHYDFDEEELEGTTFQATKYFEYVKSESEANPQKGDENDRFGDKVIENQSFRGIFRVTNSKGKKEARDLIVEVGNRSVLLALKENDLPIPGWELFDFPAVDEQYGRLYAMGVVEPARDSFIEEFVKQNQSMDSANREVYATYIGDAAACANLPEIVETSNDQILKVDVMGAGLTDVSQALRVLERPRLGQDTFSHALTLGRTVQQTMGLSDYTQNTNPAGGAETATGVVELVGASESLDELMIEKLGDTYFRPITWKKLILWNFFNAEKEHVVFDQNGQKVNIAPGEINFPYHLSLETGVSQTTTAQSRRMVEVFPVIKDDPFYDALEVRKTLNDMLELPNKNSLLRNEEYERMVVERENMAIEALSILQQGGQIPEDVDVPVHPFDNQQRHLEGHINAGIDGPLMQRHIEGHQAIIEQQNEALGNTKDRGGNAGNLAQPEAASMRGGGPGATGAFTPSAGRA